MSTPEEIAALPRNEPAEGGDAKYGGLYTEDDLTLFVVRMFDAEGQKITRDDARRYMEGVVDELAVNDQLTFPADEPLFLLRGKDEAIYGTLRAYADEIRRLMFQKLQGQGLHSLDDPAIRKAKLVMHAVSTTAARIKRWQRQTENEDLVRLPD